MAVYHVQVNDGTGWQTVSIYASADEARETKQWYEDRRLRARVTFDEGDAEDERLSVAVDRMIEEES